MGYKVHFLTTFDLFQTFKSNNWFELQNIWTASKVNISVNNIN